METVNHECYVSLEVAKLLKKAGFDWACNGVFISEDDTQYAFIKMDAACDNNNSKYNPYNISTPTLDVAQRWLREKLDLIITIDYNYHKGTFLSKIYSKSECLSILFDCLVYEEAQETGIKKALEMILEKGE